MEMEIERHGDKTVVIMHETRLDAALSVRFKEALKKLTDQGANYMVLDMSHVGFMDSSGLGAVVAHLKYTGKKRRFELANLSPNVAKVFRLTRMDSVFKIHPSLDVVQLHNTPATQ